MIPEPTFISENDKFKFYKPTNSIYNAPLQRDINASILIAEEKASGKQEYILIYDNSIIHASTSLEAIFAKVDVLWLDKEFKE